MKLFVFDIDGTLTDSVAVHHASYLHAYSQFEIPNLDTNWNGYTHHSDSWIFGEVFRQNFDRNPTESEKAKFSATLIEHFENSIKDNPIREVPGAVNFFRRVADNPQLGYAFATGSLREPAIQKLQALNIDFPGELLSTASEKETREEIVQAAILGAKQYFGVEHFEQIVAFGDGYWDLVAARNLNLEFVGIAEDTRAEKLQNSGATNIYANFLVHEITSWCT